jgi:hypothetical protein
MELTIPKIYVKWSYVFQIDTTTDRKEFLLIWTPGHGEDHLGKIHVSPGDLHRFA